MRIAVVGGAGTVGKHVTGELTRRGHEVRVLSRSSPDFPVDLASGAGLDAALTGCSVVVDASNASSRQARRVLVQGSRKLLAAEQAAGVGHHVGISIVGCDRLPVGYYRVKVEQEQVLTTGQVPCSIVRATQFHELAATALTAAGRYRVLPVPSMRVQTIAASEVARTIADVAENPPAERRVTRVAGPEISTARDLARTWQAATGRAALLLPLPPLPGKTGRALRAGVLTTNQADVLGTITFADWLASAHDS